MEQYIGAVFFDIDGTLIEAKRGITQISARLEKALPVLREKGYLTCVASGRSRGYLPELGGHFGGYITCNGAVAEIEGKVLFEKYVEPEKLRRFTDYMDKHGFGYILENSEECFTTEFGSRTYQGLAGRLSKNYDCFYPLADLEHPESLRVTKLQIACDNEPEFRRIQEVFAADFDIMPHRYEMAADVEPLGTSKASGILDVLERLHIPRKNTYAFGDDNNDVEMIRTVAHGVVMTPHVPALDGLAEYVTGTVEEDGVYFGLRHFGLVD